MTFYGVPPEDKAIAMERALEIVGLFKKSGMPIVFADNMLVALRSTSFMSDPDFSDAIRKYCFDAEQQVIVDNMAKFWRLHIYTWCCRQALLLEGSLVECGVHMGLYSLTMMKTLSFQETGKQMYLYDTFSGLSDEYSSAFEREIVDDSYNIPDWESEVRNRFSIYPNAHVIKGTIPEILNDTAPEAVSFLHLDLNAAAAEEAAFEFFKQRLVPGAVILLDDFGRTEYIAMNKMYNKMFGELGLSILELPTGQGMVIWH